MKVYIKGIAYNLPEKILTNEMIAQEFPEWSVEKIDKKIGIKQRHVTVEGETASDLAVGAVAAMALYPHPLMVIDMGTATTICVVDKDGIYRGGIIAPGVKVSMESLTKNAAQLQSIGLYPPKKAIGTNTADCMRSGLVFGNAAMLDGLIDRMAQEIEGTPTVIATGGLASSIIPYCSHDIILNNELLLVGLRIIYDKNT